MMAVSAPSPCPCEKLGESSPKCMEDHSTRDDASIPSSNFDCSICLDLVQDPVVTMCGHLFCWSCLHQWITIHSALEECPVCKACVKNKIIPLYGKGKVGFANPDTKTIHAFTIPRRPAAHQSTATAASTGFQHHSFISHENLARLGGVAGFQDHSLISHEYRGRDLAYSAAAFGLFPALFGFHTTTFPEYNSSGFSSVSAYNSPFRLPASNGMTSQHRLNAQQEFVLYWFLVLLASFAIVCFLLF